MGGPLLDAGYSVTLIDADLAPLALPEIARRVQTLGADVALIGHSGSSSAHATVVQLCRELKQALPALTIVYGGVYPTYHWDEILAACPEVDVIVRGEGERTTLRLIQALERGDVLASVDGLAFRENGAMHGTPPAQLIRDLDDYRVGWELIDHARYSYWGGKRAVVVQFSRGCTHGCNYCGQRGYWTQYRHRDSVRFARELARLHREQDVELINFADELPTGSRPAWQAFLEALIAENVPLLLVGSTRTSDIVRDADILPLYRKAGVIRFLLGVESYDAETLRFIKKGVSPGEDQRAIELLRECGIVSMVTCVIGFREERDRDYWHAFRQLLRYDPDQVQLMYVTPHRWTRFYATVAARRVVQPDTRRWDYKHQVLATPGVPVWRVFAWFKLIEALMQLRPRVLLRYLFHRDGEYRHAMRWYTRIGRRVWFYEVVEFLFRTRLLRDGPALEEFLGPSP